MNGRHGAIRSFMGAALVFAGGASTAWGQAATAPVPSENRGWPASVVERPARRGGTYDRPDWAVQRALRANPLTAPYPIFAVWRDGKIVLQGRAGTKQVHDVAVRTAIAFGFPFRDDLVIDTAEALRVAMGPPVMPVSAPGAYRGPSAGAGVGAGANPNAGRANGPVNDYYGRYRYGPGGVAPNASYYVYPPPLFGRLDDPFFGMVPPLLTFPPWWRPQPSERSMIGPNAGPNGGPDGPMAPGSRSTAPDSAPNGPNAGGLGEFEPPPAKGDVQITVDANGQVFLRGVVASEEDARAIEEAARSVPGVGRVHTQFQIQPRRAEPNEDEPPPLPKPVEAPKAPKDHAQDQDQGEARDRDQEKDKAPEPPRDGARPGPKGAAEDAPDQTGAGPAGADDAPPAIRVAALDDRRLSRRAAASLSKRPAIAGLPIHVRSDDDVIVLTGKVPTAYEAMIAFRAAQRTPGVREVVDRLEFLVPDENHENPLLEKARPEDLEPYLTAQIAHHLGDLAHIDAVRARGDHLEIQGTVLDRSDLDRALAILRSVPVLHGFQLEPAFLVD